MLHVHFCIRGPLWKSASLRSRPADAAPASAQIEPVDVARAAAEVGVVVVVFGFCGARCTEGRAPGEDGRAPGKAGRAPGKAGRAPGKAGRAPGNADGGGGGALTAVARRLRARCSKNPTKGATPVPGPTIRIGASGSSGRARPPASLRKHGTLSVMVLPARTGLTNSSSQVVHNPLRA